MNARWLSNAERRGSSAGALADVSVCAGRRFGRASTSCWPVRAPGPPSVTSLAADAVDVLVGSEIAFKGRRAKGRRRARGGRSRIRCSGIDGKRLRSNGGDEGEPCATQDEESTKGEERTKIARQRHRRFLGPRGGAVRRRRTTSWICPEWQVRAFSVLFSCALFDLRSNARAVSPRPSSCSRAPRRGRQLPSRIRPRQAFVVAKGIPRYPFKNNALSRNEMTGRARGTWRADVAAPLGTGAGHVPERARRRPPVMRTSAA